MKNNKFTKNIIKTIFPVLAFGMPLAFAQDYHVEPVQSIGVQDAVTLSTMELLKSGIRKSGGTVSDLAGPETYIVKSRLVGLGGSVILQAEKVLGQKSVFAVELKAASVEELDKVADRVARSLVEQKGVNEDKKISEVTQSEVNNKNLKLDAEKHWFVGFGPGYVGNTRSYSVLTRFDIDYAWMVGDYDMKFYGNITTPLSSGTDGSTTVMAGIGSNYYLTQKVNAPFVFAGVGLGFSFVQENSSEIEDELDQQGQVIPYKNTGGFSVSLGGGYTIARTSKVNFSIFGNVSTIFANTGKGFPVVSSLGVGLNF